MYLYWFVINEARHTALNGPAYMYPQPSLYILLTPRSLTSDLLTRSGQRSQPRYRSTGLVTSGNLTFPSHTSSYTTLYTYSADPLIMLG